MQRVALAEHAEDLVQAPEVFGAVDQNQDAVALRPGLAVAASSIDLRRGVSALLRRQEPVIDTHEASSPPSPSTPSAKEKCCDRADRRQGQSRDVDHRADLHPLGPNVGDRDRAAAAVPASAATSAAPLVATGVGSETGAAAESAGGERLDERDHGALTHDGGRADGAVSAARALEGAGNVLGPAHESGEPPAVLGLLLSCVPLFHGPLLVRHAPSPEWHRHAESPADPRVRHLDTQHRQHRHHEHEDRPARRRHPAAPQPHRAGERSPHATATPSNTAAFTPRRARSARNGTGSTSAARPCTPAAGPLRAARPGAMPARRAAATARTAPAAIAVRSITPYTTDSRICPRHPHTSTRADPHPSSTPRRPGHVNRRVSGSASRAVAHRTPGNARTRSAIPTVTGANSREPIGSGNQTSSGLGWRSSRHAPSRHSKTGSRRDRRTGAIDAGPAAPARATWISSTVSRAAAA